MTALEHSIDLVIGTGLLFVAWRSLSCSDLFKAILLFVAFSLLMSLAWVRLNAPDIALAEATIGAGLTGAILLAALAQLRTLTGKKTSRTRDNTTLATTVAQRWQRALVILPVGAGLIYVVATFESVAPGLGSELAVRLPAAGVSNPVTAVLLNFRAYDTLLEMLVLLLALLGVWSCGGPVQHANSHVDSPALGVFAQLSIPLLILVAGYLLLVGSSAPGGAFQAGSVLGATGVLLHLSGRPVGARFSRASMRPVFGAGVSVFVAIAVISGLLQGEFLQYPPEYAGLVILAIETASAVAIGATLTALFFLGPPPPGEEPG